MFLHETAQTKSHSSIIDFVTTTDGTKEIKSIFGLAAFDFPKPSDLIASLINQVAGENDIILDSFSGSGTTAHAVLKLNAQDQGRRRFILIEMMEYAETLTAERVRRVMTGYGQDNKILSGLGGGFDYYTIGEPMFLPNSNLNEAVGIAAIRHYVAYTEGIQASDRISQNNPYSPYLLGLNSNIAWLFYYEADNITVLDLDFLGSLKFGNKKPCNAIVYADRCLLEKNFMVKHGIIFKKIPRDITRF